MMNFEKLVSTLVETKPWTIENLQRIFSAEFLLKNESEYWIDYEATNVSVGDGLTAEKITLRLDGVTKDLLVVHVVFTENSNFIDLNTARKQYKSTTERPLVRTPRPDSKLPGSWKITQDWGSIKYFWRSEMPGCVAGVMLERDLPLTRKPLSRKMDAKDEEMLEYVLEKLKSAENHLAEKQWKEANDLMWLALENLGERYLVNGRLYGDGSASDIEVGLIQEARSLSEEASSYYHDALKYRYEQFAKKVAGAKAA